MSILNLPKASIPCQPSDDAGGDIVQFLLDGLPSSALLTDGSGKVIMVNNQAERFLGWPAAKLIGQPAHEWFDCYFEELAAEPEDCPIARMLQGENMASSGRMWLSAAVRWRSLSNIAARAILPAAAWA